MPEERDILDLLNEYANLGDEIRPMERRREEVGKIIKSYLLDNDLPDLRDGEHGITAKIQDRGTGQFVGDWETLPEESIIQAARRGWVKMNVKQFLDWAKDNDAVWADMLKDHIRDGGTTLALILERD